MVEVLPIPPLSLSGRVPPSNSVVTLDTSSAHVDLTLWPDFHNGAAAALRLGYRDLLNGQRSSPMIEVTRNWIIYNRTASQSTAGGESSHAGNFTLALPLHMMIVMYMVMMMLLLLMMMMVMTTMMMVVIVMMIVMMMMVAIVMMIMIAIVMMLVMMILTMMIVMIEMMMMMIRFSSRLPLRTGSAGTPVHSDRRGHLRVLDTGTRAHHNCSADRVGGFQDRFR
jgi:hypothetical protein